MFFFCLSLFYQYVHLVKPGNNPHIKNVSIGLGQFQQLMRIKLFPPPYPVQRITKRAKNLRGKKDFYERIQKEKRILTKEQKGSWQENSASNLREESVTLRKVTACRLLQILHAVTSSITRFFCCFCRASGTYQV